MSLSGLNGAPPHMARCTSPPTRQGKIRRPRPIFRALGVRCQDEDLGFLVSGFRVVGGSASGCWKHKQLNLLVRKNWSDTEKISMCWKHCAKFWNLRVFFKFVS